MPSANTCGNGAWWRRVCAEAWFCAVAAAAVVLVGSGLIGHSEDPLKIGVSPAWLATGVLATASGLLHVLGVRRRLAGPPRRLLPRLRLLWVSLCLGWLATLAWATPFLPARVAVAMGSALGAFAAVDLLGPRMAARLPGRPLRWLEFAVTTACVVVFALECSLRLLSRFSGSPLLARPDAGIAETIARFRYPPGLPRFWFPCNSAGYYDEEFTAKEPGVPLVVSVGDSFGAGVVPHRVHFTTQIERLLPPTRVHNLGVPAIGPVEYLHLLRTEGLPMAPDLVLVNLFVGNDVEQGRRDAIWPWLSSWFAADNLMLALVPKRIAAVTAEQRALGRREVGIVGERSTGPAPEGALPDWVLDPTLEPPTHSQEMFAQIERERAAVVCNPRWKGYEPCLERLEAIAAAVGVERLVFVLIPDCFQVEDGLWDQVRGARVGLERDLPQRKLVAWCAERGLHCLDLLPALRAAPPWSDGRLHVYHERDTHWNARGNLVAAHAIARYVAPLLHLDGAASRPTFTAYGDGCAGRDGRQPALAGREGPGPLPILVVTDAPPGCAGMLRIGSGRGSGPIPSERCRVQILPLLPGEAWFRTDAGGRAEVGLPMPFALQGMDVYAQAMVQCEDGLLVTNPLAIAMP